MRELERIQPDVKVIPEAFSGRGASVMLTDMTLSEALQQFDGVVKDVMGAFAVCCGIPVVMDSDFRRPKIYCITCGRTVMRVKPDRWIVTEWGTKGIKPSESSQNEV